MHRLIRQLLLVLALFVMGVPAHAASGVATSWQLIDYIAVDYAGAVQDGRVVNRFEYDEMREFSRNVSGRLNRLPAHPARASLIADSRTLERLIEARAPIAAVERAARRLGDRLLAAYPVTIAPDRPPDAGRGRLLYRQHCASCHGADGAARVPAAAAMDPPPIAFTDRGRARQRSLFALYQVVTQGLDGTAMRSFAELPPQDRWAVAFEAGRFAFPISLAPAGERSWEDPQVRSLVPTLEALVGMNPSELVDTIGNERADALTAFLRHNPDQLAGGRAPLAIARARLAESLAAYRGGDRDRAADLALAAYLDGFEPVEALLAARRGSLVAAVEREMAGLRAAIGRGEPAREVEARAARLFDLFEQSESALAPEGADSASTALGAFAILVREGLEALLIVIAMIGFLVRGERRELLRYVHAGWVSALIAGVTTWWAASYAIEISGAGRELTEGFGSLLAAAVLLFVGLWMHGKSRAGAWQLYVKERLGRALDRRSAWFLFGLAFIAVYREVFETILFFAAIGAQGQNGAMLAGIGAAAVLLALIAWAMLRFSRRLPIGKFFQYSAALIAILAVVLAGKGMAALQEAGLIGVTLVNGPRSPILGLYPSAETLAAQLAVVLVLIAGYWRGRRTAMA